MNRSPKRRGIALLATAAVGAASLTAVAATHTPSAHRSLTNGSTEFSYSAPTITVTIPRGKTKVRVVLGYRNTGSTEHTIAVRGAKLKPRRSKVAGVGASATITALVGPGRYTYYCWLPGHAKNGMKGILKVVQGV
ncbi:MAG: plastocyanin/azurin family copper-binding protein [Thermoleophilia bacterium]